jgi:hypothetical protein
MRERPAMKLDAGMTLLWGTLGLAGLGLGVVSVVQASTSPPPARAMATAAARLLDSLGPDQRKKASFSLEDAHRVEWFYVPLERKGITVKELSPAQRELAFALMKSALSDAGYSKATQIMELDKVLAVMEKNPVRRDPEKYYFSVFGTPTPDGTWGFRVEGHHVSLNFTVVKGRLVATTPEFLGANPAEVRIDGPYKGRRVLHAEEDLGRQLVKSLDDKQRAQAVFDKTAPGDIASRNLPKIDPLAPVGIAFSALAPPQQELLRKLMNEYAARLPAPMAAERLARAEKAGWDKIRFGWAGGLERGQGHYYRIQGPTFLVEYDCTQNDANHIHTVWREYDGDFGRDLLREHYQAAHASH